jgi:HlyD family secretion protein
MKRIKLVAIILIAIVIISTGIWWGIYSSSSETSTDILTSGFIEAKDVAVAPETGGRLVEIAAEEGDRIEAGVTLVKLDDSLLKAQKQQAEANVKLAQAYLEQAQATRDGAEVAWQNAVEVQLNPLELDAKINAAEGELALARLDLLREQDIESDLRVPAAEIRLDTADKLVWNYRRAEYTLGLGSQYDRRVNTLRAEDELAQAELNLSYQQKLQENWSIPKVETRYDIAQQALEDLLAIKDNPQDINAAVDQAYSSYQTALAAVKAAEMQVEQSEAALKVIETQISQLSISSPMAGVVALRQAEVGEIAQPGAPILTITQLDEVTLTAYVPESKIGLVKLGQKVLVSVDSYPGDSFSGEVVFISPQAQFTPRNVQLKEEREKTVFAVKIRLGNPEQKLKPGMPADARIITGSEG